jgi:spermidine synthase
MKPTGKQFIAEFINCSVDILNDQQTIERILSKGIEKCGLNLVSINSHSFNPIGVTSIAIISESHIAIHTYPEARHASLDIFTCSDESQLSLDLLHFLKDELDPDTVRIAEMKRGNPLDIIHTDWITDFSESIGFEVRYHIEEKILNTRSEYQQIKVINNETFGRMLFLDGELQIAAADAHIYNQSMVSPLIEADNSLNSVAILGGGDGGVLYELLKHNPGSVTLIDIDEEVINTSKKYLKDICFDAFDHPGVTIIYADANTFLDENHDFDAIVYDLTMHPESFINIDREIYLDRIFSKIRDNLKEGGIVSVQCCSQFDATTRDMITEILNKHFSDVTFTKSYIPSYCVSWVFASAKRK